jgi:ELWxxDGT repeat protein
MKQIYFMALLLISSIANSQITLVKDINSGIGNSFPNNLTAFNGKLYFTADDESGINTNGIDYGKELWVSDGTTEGTVFLKNINSYDTDGILTESVASNISYFFELNNTLYFTALDQQVGSAQIFTTDGTTTGTTSLGIDATIRQPIIINNKAYMRADIVTGDVTENLFYEFDGTTFQEVADTGTGAITFGPHYAELDSNSILMYMEYIEAGAELVGSELYLYNITDQKYTLVKNMDGGAEDSGLSYFTKLGDDVYFEYDSGLYVTDGTTAGTTIVQVAYDAFISNIKNLYSWNNKLFFEGDDGIGGDQLWVYDPALNTVTDLSELSGNHDPIHYAELSDGYLYYAAKSVGSTSYHLFRTDGTDIELVDPNIKDVDEIVTLNDKLYFEADDVINSLGNELYTYTSTPSTILSTSDFDLDNSLSIYPNPSVNMLNVQSALRGEVSYTFYNLLGKQVLNGTIKNNVINHNLTSGLYLLKLVNGSKSVTKKVVVKN